MKAAGIIPKGVLDLFGLQLKSLLKAGPESPMQVSGDDLLLDPERALPPPRIRGKLTKAWIADGLVYEQFGGEKPTRSLTPPVASHNFMYYRGGTLRFGKLTMASIGFQRRSNASVLIGFPLSPAPQTDPEKCPG